MPIGIRPSQTAETNNRPPVQSPQTAAPLGISEQQTTITSEPDGSSSPFAFLHTIGEFFRSTCVSILETINSLLGSFASFVRGGPKEELPPDAWMLPSDTPAPAETPTTQPRPTPTETPPLATVVTTPSAPDPFSSLPINFEEKRKIFHIVHTLGTTNPILLLPQQSTLEQLGREIEHVHPFKFLEYILLHPTLRADLDTVRNNSLLWPQFLDGLANKLTRERQGLSNYMPGFAHSLQIPPANLEPFLRSGNWQAMTFYLIDVKLGRLVLPPTPQADPTPTTPPNTSQSPPLTVPDAPVQTQAAPSPWSQIQLSENEKIMVADLVRSHKNMGYYAATLGDRYVDSLWDRLDQAHPLALLTHLYTTGELVTDLNLLWPYRMHRRYFTSELIKHLNRRPEADYLPHLAAFAAAARKDLIAISAQIHLRRWPELIEVLRAPNIE